MKLIEFTGEWGNVTKCSRVTNSLKEINAIVNSIEIYS